jgi:branched-chain amino acid transport system ATP-binding protein
VIDESMAHTVATAEYCYLLEGGRIRHEAPAAEFARSDLLAIAFVGASG